MKPSPHEPQLSKHQSNERRSLSDRARARTEARQQAFVRAFEEAGTVTAACTLTRTGRRTIYDWARDPTFADAFDRARDVVADRLEAECRRRAMGTDAPVYYRGQVVGHLRKYSDALLLALLNAYRPEKFRNRREHTGKDGEPISVVHVTYDKNMTPDDMGVPGNGAIVEAGRLTG